MSTQVNANYSTHFVGPEKTSLKAKEPKQIHVDIDEPIEDEIELSKSAKNNPPQLSGTRIFFNRLTNEQIQEINRTGKLPKNAKFIKNPNGEGFYLTNNWFNVTAGTDKLPSGYELKKGFLGFTIVVPEGTKGLFIKDAA